VVRVCLPAGDHPEGDKTLYGGSSPPRTSRLNKYCPGGGIGRSEAI